MAKKKYNYRKKGKTFRTREVNRIMSITKYGYTKYEAELIYNRYITRSRSRTISKRFLEKAKTGKLTILLKERELARWKKSFTKEQWEDLKKQGALRRQSLNQIIELETYYARKWESDTNREIYEEFQKETNHLAYDSQERKKIWDTKYEGKVKRYESKFGSPKTNLSEAVEKAKKTIVVKVVKKLITKS